jgi:hypothetical protein
MTLGRTTTESDVDRGIDAVVGAVRQLRAGRPLVSS